MGAHLDSLFLVLLIPEDAAAVGTQANLTDTVGAFASRYEC